MRSVEEIVAEGRSYLKLRMFADAEKCFRDGAAAAPKSFLLHYYFAATLQAQERLDEAIASYGMALELNPRDADSHHNLGLIFRKLRAYDAATDHFRQTIEINPSHAKAHENLAGVLADQGQYELALAHRRRAMELNPSLERAPSLSPRLEAASHFYHAHTLQAMGQLDEAIAAYRGGIELDPTNARLHSNLVYLLNFHPEYDAATIFTEHRHWAQRHAENLTAAVVRHTNDPTPTRRLRIGYVSAHFCAHSISYFIEPLLAAHDHHVCETYCYSDVEHDDETTGRMRPFADHWRPIAGCSDEEVSQTIRNDRIDILVDLAGHIAGNRLLVFARKPAPVQVSYLGYQNTTGMTAMDYRLTDAWSDPPGLTESFHTEKLVRLPGAFFCFLPSGVAPPTGSLPAGLNGYVTFGSFNNFTKITPRVLSTWGELMRQVPKSRFVLLAALNDNIRQQVQENFERFGIGTDRLRLVGPLPRKEYLQVVSRVDIALDPFPFNGHTTTCESLWMGVPVITQAGQTYASRFGGSALAALGLSDLIAGTRDEYQSIAVRLANDLPRLQTLRESLRRKFRESVLMDAASFARKLEAAYRQMWVEWCSAGDDAADAKATMNNRQV